MKENRKFDEARYRRTARRMRRFEDRHRHTGLTIEFLTGANTWPVIKEAESQFFTAEVAEQDSILRRVTLAHHICVVLRWVKEPDGSLSQEVAAYFLLKAVGDGGAAISRFSLDPAATDPDLLLEYVVNWLETISNETDSWFLCEKDNRQRSLLRLHLPELGLVPVAYDECQRPVGYCLYFPSKIETDGP